MLRHTSPSSVCSGFNQMSSKRRSPLFLLFSPNSKQHTSGCPRLRLYKKRCERLSNCLQTRTVRYIARVALSLALLICLAISLFLLQGRAQEYCHPTAHYRFLCLHLYLHWPTHHLSSAWHSHIIPAKKGENPLVLQAERYSLWHMLHFQLYESLHGLLWFIQYQ